MTSKTKSIADLIRGIDQVEAAINDLSDVSTALFRNPETATALTGVITEMHGGVITRSASQRIGVAESILRDYKRLLEDITEATNLKWPPAAAIISDD